MLTKSVKSFILAVGVSMVLGITSFAASISGGSAFPFDIEFDVEKCDRICYAGHPSNTVIYRDGYAVTPTTLFRIVSKSGEATSSVSDLAVSISVVYENDSHSGSYKETVKQYNAGDLNSTDEFKILSDNTASNLDSRSKLYSDSLSGFEMTLNYKSKDIKKKTVYLYVCSDEDYEEYLMNAPETFEDEADESEDLYDESEE